MTGDKDTRCENLIKSMEKMAEQVRTVAVMLDVPTLERFIGELMKANPKRVLVMGPRRHTTRYHKKQKRVRRLFIMGAGRSGLVARAFAMRLMHLGMTVYVVGETTTPSVQEDDLVVAISGSGETRSIANLGRIAKDIGSMLVTITSNSNSTLGKLSDIVVIIPGRTKEDVKREANEYLERRMRGAYSLIPLGTSFEISSLVFLDAVIVELMVRLNLTEADLNKMHAILE